VKNIFAGRLNLDNFPSLFLFFNEINEHVVLKILPQAAECNPMDNVIYFSLFVGILISLLNAILPKTICFVSLFANFTIYLSLTKIGHVFYSQNNDKLFAEIAFFSIFLIPKKCRNGHYIQDILSSGARDIIIWSLIRYSITSSLLGMLQ